MTKNMIALLGLCVMGVPVTLLANEPFDFIIDSGFQGPFNLDNSERLQMTGGGFSSLNLSDSSYAEILSTSPFQQAIGGIEELNATGSSSFLISGGDIHSIVMSSNATGTISGGNIDLITTFQVIPDPHIEMLVRDYEFNAGTNVLTGTWEDFSTFDIQLINRDTPWAPVIDNIKFTIIPEPTSLILFGMGAMLLKNKRKRILKKAE